MPDRTTAPFATLTASLAVGALLAGAGLRPAAGQAAFTFHELAPGVVAAVVDPDVPSYAFANSLIVIGEDGVLVVDTQQSPHPAGEVLAEIRRRTDLPVRWVVNTHHHGDHVWGNQVYADAFPDAVFIATPTTRDSVQATFFREIAKQRTHTVESRARLREMLETETDPDRVNQIEAAIDRRRRYLSDLDALRMIPPEGRVAERLRIDLGGRHVVLLNVGPAHTPGDLVVWLPASRIAMVGDLVEEGELWLEGADVAGWVRALDRVLALHPAVLVPGHGGAQTDLELIRAQREELEALAGQTGP